MNMYLKQQKKAVIYCRVSTKEQAEEGNSLVTQERNCREYAQKYGYSVTHVFIEEGESAKTADRTELQKLLRLCADRNQAIKAVIIYKIDRLSRNTDDYSQIRILLKRYSVEIKSTSEYFENTPAGRFMENIIANVAQFDNDVRTERSIGGMKDAAREGRYVWRAPVGYTNQKVDGKSTIVPSDKAGLVLKAFELMAERKYTVEKIMDTLYSMGLTSKNGRRLQKSGFYDMLNNELYTGWIHMFGEIHKGTFESLVPEALFNRVQQVMKNKKISSMYRKENPDFPLRRVIIHPNRHKLTGAWSQGRSKKYPYYRFLGTKMYWPKDHLESKFRSYMDQFAFNKLLLAKLIQEIQNRFLGKSREKESDIEVLVINKMRIKEKQNALLQKNINGIIGDTLLKEQLIILDEEIWNIDKVLLQKEENKVDVKRVLDFISEFLLYPSATWEKAPLEIKQKLHWFQFPEGVLFDGKEFRTTKLSSIFKLKETFLAQMSSKVHYPGLNYEHENSANFPPLQTNKSVVWDEILGELRIIEGIIHTPESVEEELLV